MSNNVITINNSGPVPQSLSVLNNETVSFHNISKFTQKITFIGKFPFKKFPNPLFLEPDAESSEFKVGALIGHAHGVFLYDTEPQRGNSDGNSAGGGKNDPKSGEIIVND